MQMDRGVEVGERSLWVSARMRKRKWEIVEMKDANEEWKWVRVAFGSQWELSGETETKGRGLSASKCDLQLRLPMRALHSFRFQCARSIPFASNARAPFLSLPMRSIPFCFHAGFFISPRSSLPLPLAHRFRILAPYFPLFLHVA